MKFYKFFTNKNNIIIFLSIIIILSLIFLFDTMNIEAQKHLNKIYTNAGELQKTYGNFLNENLEIISENDIIFINFFSL